MKRPKKANGKTIRGEVAAKQEDDEQNCTKRPKSAVRRKNQDLVIHPFRKQGDRDKGECDSKYCPGCAEGFIKPWIQCQRCLNILHNECLGLLPETHLTFSKFICSGCKPNACTSLKNENYHFTSRKLRRTHMYIKSIMDKKLFSWRMQSYLRGGNARRDLKYYVYSMLYNDAELENVLQICKDWLQEWHTQLTETEIVSFSLDVLLPELTIHVITQTEGIYRDHAEYLYSQV